MRISAENVPTVAGSHMTLFRPSLPRIPKDDSTPSTEVSAAPNHNPQRNADNAARALFFSLLVTDLLLFRNAIYVAKAPTSAFA